MCETGAVSDVSFAASHSRSAPTSPLAKTMLMMLMMRRTMLTLLMVRMMLRRNMEFSEGRAAIWALGFKMENGDGEQGALELELLQPHLPLLQGRGGLGY